VVASRVYQTGLPEYIGREVMNMTDFEIIMILLEVVGLPITSGLFLISLLNFLDKRNKKHK
jgi:hypothetical protein